MRKHVFAIIFIVLLLSSCNWDIMTSHLDEVSGKGSGSGTYELFDGSAPRNVYATQAGRSGEVVLSFNGVSGADYYIIERAVMPKGSDTEPAENDWRMISTIYSEGKGKSYFYTDESASDGDSIYLYRVKAGSYYADFLTDIRAMYSDTARGWPLSPPTSLNVSQGEYEGKIILEWSQIDLVRGYNVYMRSADSRDYEIVNKDGMIPAAIHVDTITYECKVDENLAGVDIDFYVESISRGNHTSEPSGKRSGYTYVKGAPGSPQGLAASDAYSSSYIEIKWEKPDTEGSAEDGSYYRWEIYRSTPVSDQVLVDDFVTNENVEGGYYVYRDTSSSLEGGVEYTYTVRAVLVIPSPTGEDTEYLGKSASDTGCLITPALVISNDATDFDSGIFSFDIALSDDAVAPTCDDWQYSIYGRRNDLGQSIGEWRHITDLEGTKETVHVSLQYGDAFCGDCNEFDVRITDSEGNESGSYSEYAEISAIVTERAEAPSIAIADVSANFYSAELSANSNGVYPVRLLVNDETQDEAKYEIEAFSLNTYGESVSRGSKGNLSEGVSYILDFGTLSPETVGEKYYYRIRRSDRFGRYSEWSTEQSDIKDRGVEGYGAVTGATLIKFFEAYAMKPWEFISHSDFPQNLKAKWSASAIYDKIRNEATSANITEYSEYHDGSIHYNVSANIAAMAGDISFSYHNFGELETIWTESGSYTMRVSLSGNGSVPSSEDFVVKGMYPAVISIKGMSITAKAFNGDYTVTQENGLVEKVKATRN